MGLIKDKKQRIKIKTKMKMVMVILLVPLITIYSLEIKNNYETKIEKHTNSIENLVNLVGSFFGNIFKNTWFLETEIGKDFLDDIDENGNYLNYDSNIENLINKIYYIENLSIFDKNGNYISGINKLPESEEDFIKYNENFKSSDAYKQFQEGKTEIVSNSNDEFKNGDMHIGALVEGKNQKEIIVVSKINLEKFKNEKFKNINEDYGIFGVMDNKSNFIYSQGIEEGILEEKDFHDMNYEKEMIIVDIKDTEWKAYSQGYLSNYVNKLRKEIAISLGFLIVVAIIIIVISRTLMNDVINGTNHIREVLEDITKNKKMNKTNMKKKDEIGEIGEGIDLIVDQLESFDKERNSLSLVMAHEIRTPVNIVYSAVQLLEQISNEKVEDSDKEAINKYHKLIKENCYRLSKLVNNITISNQISSNQLEMKRENVEIISAIEDFINIVINNAKVIKERDIEVVFDTECESCVLACDYEKINKVILNILSNAIKFTENNGKVFIEVKENERYLEISIIDNGKGISKDTIHKIFEKYTNGEEILNRSAEGIGLGLYISKSIIEEHGGKIEIESELNQGTLVRIKLPNHKIDDSENEVLYITYNESEIRKVKIEFSDVY